MLYLDTYRYTDTLYLDTYRYIDTLYLDTYRYTGTLYLLLFFFDVRVILGNVRVAFGYIR
jgi:hypothetical protein